MHHKPVKPLNFLVQDCFKCIRSFGSCVYTQGQCDSLKCMECPGSSLHSKSPGFFTVSFRALFKPGVCTLWVNTINWCDFKPHYSMHSLENRDLRKRVQNPTSFQTLENPQQGCLESSARSKSWVSRQSVTEESGADLSWTCKEVSVLTLTQSTSNGPFSRGALFSEDRCPFISCASGGFLITDRLLCQGSTILTE